MDTRLARLRRLKYWLDDAFRVPGTRLRFGWDPIIGVVPWFGDLVTAIMSLAILAQAHQMRIPRIVQLRMLVNIAVDVLVGIVPVAGDVADVFWKANTKNLALLERHAAEPRAATAGDWLFVAGMFGAVVLVALVPLAVLYWLVHTLMAHALIR